MLDYKSSTLKSYSINSISIFSKTQKFHYF